MRNTATVSVMGDTTNESGETFNLDLFDVNANRLRSAWGTRPFAREAERSNC